MVKQNTNLPVYCLEGVKSLANKGKVRWRGRRAYERCQRDFGLSFDEVCEHISWLLDTDFDKSYYYDDKQAPDDGYEVEIRNAQNRRDIAYIKVRIDDDGLELDIGSFHR